MACAARATASGAKVMVIDHARKPLRKLLVTGGGKCNITNRNVLPEHYVSGNPSFTRSALTHGLPLPNCCVCWKTQALPWKNGKKDNFLQTVHV